MDLSGIISISGRPGLYKVIAQGKNSIIVESLTEKKRFPAYSSDRISALEDISIYTIDDDKPLKEIYTDIYKKVDGKEAPSHKEDISTLQEFLSDILPDYDEERVYPSDIKKLFQWYNILQKAGVLEIEEEKVEVIEEPKAEEAEKKPVKKTPAKKAPAKKKPAAKTAEAKKKPAAKASGGTKKKSTTTKK
ncbi:MAG: DUF5606 domain-containing protein [Crocinitomicaceae bacterium]|nr:DUF5606 domain-containing protein [Crocinitomicaceae bacterium]